MSHHSETPIPCRGDPRPLEPLPDPNKFERRKDEADRQANKRKNADIQAEYNAMACVALYMLLMSFSQKGIDKLADFQEHMKMKHPDGKFVVSEGFDDGEFFRAGSRVHPNLPDSLGVGPIHIFILIDSLVLSVEMVQGAFHTVQ